ncbi:MAG TPA: DeoR family transcriptional regulator [Anaerolineae bacterium]|nr:DeoR family transcriptional regulator [Anaerolineae bacterium]
MADRDRHEKIVNLVGERGFLSVRELSEQLDVSEMTIRRDLSRLEQQGRLKKTYGGAASTRSVGAATESAETLTDQKAEGPLVDMIDVLIATSVNPLYDALLLDRVQKRRIPVIAESVELPEGKTVVAVDNIKASRDLGQWVGHELQRRGQDKARLLDLSFHLRNTQTRSQSFWEGLHEVCPDSEMILSLDAQSTYHTAYQLARDALTVYRTINVIFAINDSTALGAIHACRDLHLDPCKIMVVTFGLEGNTLIEELMSDRYCKAGLAMFPEIVSLACLEAAIMAYNREPLPAKLVTPHVVLTKDTLPEFYTREADGWRLNWENARARLSIPIPIDFQIDREKVKLPRQIGLTVPFSEHEWYKNLTAQICEYAARYKIDSQILEPDQSLRDEVDLRRRQIAHLAAELVNPRDVILLEGGEIAHYLAEELKQKQDITVITNSLTVLNILNHTPGIVLISTGGAVRYSSQVLVGPTAENALRDLRADKLFLTVSGIALEFGLSHTNISEVTIKQAMIRAAREVILLADHSSFGQESMVQVAPVNAVHKVITDDALPASVRLDLSKAGIQIILAKE